MAVSVDRGRGLRGALGGGGLIVALVVEGHEEGKEGEENKLLEPEDEGGVGPGEVAKAANVRHRDDREDTIDELDELSHGEILLPRGGMSHRSHQVAPVHESVDETVGHDTVHEEEHASLKVGERKRGDNGVMLFWANESSITTGQLSEARESHKRDVEGQG